jgi:hypothetical protein
MIPPRLSACTVLAAALLAWLSPPARAETTASVPTTAASGVTLRVATPLSIMPQFGFLPVRVSVQNQSLRAGTWKLRFLTGNPAASTGALASEFEIAAAAGENTETWYLVPLADAAPRFTLGDRPDANAGPPPPIRLVTPPPSSTAEVETRAQSKLGYGTRLNWATRMERGDRPGELIGIAVATQTISQGLETPTGRDLPLGFDAEDAIDPITGWYNRRYVYKESVPDPSGGSFPKSSFWSAVSSSLTAESAAREALAATGLLLLAPGVHQTVEVGSIETGFAGRQQAWLTTFVQTGSPRLLPLPSGLSLPPGTIVNLHGTGRTGEVVRTVTFVEPASLVPPPEAEALAAGRADTSSEEARATLVRYGFLRPSPEVRVTQVFPGTGAFVLPPQHQGARVWFESGPASRLPKPLLGSLPPDTVSYLLPGARPGEAIRCFVVAPRVRLPAPTAASGAAPGTPSQLSVTVTGPGVLGAAVVTLPGLESPKPGLALPMAISTPLAGKLRQTLYNASMRGAPNLTPIDAERLPADWRFYAPYHLVFLGGAEYVALDPARKAALRDWVLQGGLLVVEPVAVYSRMDPPLLAPRVPLELRPLGAGMMVQLSYLLDDYLAPIELDDAEEPSWIKMAEPVDLLPLLRLHQPALTLPSDEALRQPVRSPDIGGEDSASDGKWAVVILAGFALLAGPANLLVFAPAGRRHRLFFTTPLLAALFAGVFVLSILVWQGFGGWGDRAAVVMLVPGEERAVVYQDQMAATTLLGRRGFPVAESAVMTNIAVEGYDATGRAAVLERTGGDSGGDWFRNHWGSAQHLRQIVPAKGGVVVRQGAMGSTVVESTLPTTLRGFVYLEFGNRVWYAAEVPPGQAVTLRRITVRRWPPVRPAGSPYLATVLATAAQLEPGRWIAHAGTNPIAPLPTLGAITWRDRVVFTGVAAVR